MALPTRRKVAPTLSLRAARSFAAHHPLPIALIFLSFETSVDVRPGQQHLNNRRLAIGTQPLVIRAPRDLPATP